MSGLDLNDAQDAILSHIINQAPTGYQVMESDVLDGYTLFETDGIRNPAWVVQFSDLFPAAGDGSFSGPAHDGYYSILRVYSLASKPAQARKANSLINQILIGEKFANTSPLAKQWGGGQFVLGEANTRPLVFAIPAAFRFTTNISDVGATIYP